MIGTQAPAGAQLAPRAGIDAPAKPAPAAPGRAIHVMVIGGIAVGFLAGLALQPVFKDGHVDLTLLGITLPAVCWFRAVTGLPCAGCGLTRSVVLLLHGHPAASFAIHPFGGAAAGLALLQLPPRITRALALQGGWVSRWDRIWGLVLALTAVAMLVRWTITVGIAPMIGVWRPY